MDNGMKNKVILVIGGARSGKSSAAEQMVKANGGKRFYIATAPVCDSEMAERVLSHKVRRTNEQWTTIEEQLELSRALLQAEAEGAEVILLDCLTLWINNLFYHNPDFSEAEMQQVTENLVQTLKQLACCTVLVINEVGLGVVPESSLSRRFQDASGRCAQILAESADEVYFMVAGIKQRLK